MVLGDTLHPGPLPGRALPFLDLPEMMGPSTISRRPSEIATAVAGLDAWLETVRGPGGYGGPVAHWWQQSFIYTGAGLDWRYEGIIAGYLHLWEGTGDDIWLKKARRAGDDLIAGQQGDAHYAASAFEINPATAGTPHEAACNVGLLLLAQALRKAGHPGWEAYVVCAETNVRGFYVAHLWDAVTQSFQDSPHVPSFVPNKAATACDALFLLAEIVADEQWVTQYAIPTLDRIVKHQVRHGGPLDGAIAQNSYATRRVDKYFPIYIARCVPALVHGYRWTRDERYADCALRAMRFIGRWTRGDGSLPTVVYPNGETSRYPSWIAPLGDVLRAADLLAPFGLDVDFGATLRRLLDGQDASGGIQTATGFSAQAGGKLAGLLDVRDVLHVAGWCDKAFRYLASRAEPDLPTVKSKPFEHGCVFRGQHVRLTETHDVLEISCRHEIQYRWKKGTPWAEIAVPEFWLR